MWLSFPLVLKCCLLFQETERYTWKRNFLWPCLSCLKYINHIFKTWIYFSSSLGSIIIKGKKIWAWVILQIRRWLVDWTGLKHGLLKYHWVFKQEAWNSCGLSLTSLSYYLEKYHFLHHNFRINLHSQAFEKSPFVSWCMVFLCYGYLLCLLWWCCLRYHP